jgi:hypothetical protein
MKENQFPPGWNAERVRQVLVHYQSQTDDEAVAEDRAHSAKKAVVEVPVELMPAVRELIGQYQHRIRPKKSAAAQRRAASRRAKSPATKIAK